VTDHSATPNWTALDRAHRVLLPASTEEQELDTYVRALTDQQVIVLLRLNDAAQFRSLRLYALATETDPDQRLRAEALLREAEQAVTDREAEVIQAFGGDRALAVTAVERTFVG